MQICCFVRLIAVNEYNSSVKKRQKSGQSVLIYHFCIYFSGVNVKQTIRINNLIVLKL